MKRMKNKILAMLLSLSLIQSNAFAMGGQIVFDPTTYASILESIEKYNTMIKNMQDTLDTMNRINDVMNTASKQLNNLQTNLADPRLLIDRFQSNIDSIQRTFERTRDNFASWDYKNAIRNQKYAECKSRWAKLKQTEAYKKALAKNPAGQQIESTMEALTRWMDTASSSGMESANNQIHTIFDKVIQKMDITNVEEQLSPKTITQAQIEFCRLSIEQIYKAQLETCQEAFDKVKNDIEQRRDGWYKARKCRYEATKAYENNIREQRANEYNKLFKSTSVANETNFGVDGCNIVGNGWKESLGITNSNDVVTKAVTKDKDGNTIESTYCKIKEDIIDRVFKVNPSAAILLQNYNNKVIAQEGDTQSIEKSQLQTLEMISKQINELNVSVDNLAKMIAEYQNNADKKEQFQESEVYDNSFFSGFDSYTPSYKYNEFGIPKRDAYIKHDNDIEQ